MTTPDPRATARRRRPVPLVTLILLALAGAAGGLAALVLRDRTAAPAGGTPSSTPGGGREVAAGAAQTGSVDAGTALRLDTRFTADDGVTVPYSISFPAGYHDDDRTYPVIYALHGKAQTHATFMGPALHLRRAMAAGVLDDAIIVTPDGFSTGRWENGAAGPAEDNLIKRLIPHVEASYRVTPGAGQRLLAGFSMGGHGALRFGLKYPDMFAAAWSVDGAMSKQPGEYVPLIVGRPASDFRVMAVGGRVNGARVQAAVDTLRGAGLALPHVYQDREHTFEAFVQEDERAGWPAARFLQSHLSHPTPDSTP